MMGVQKGSSKECFMYFQRELNYSEFPKLIKIHQPSDLASLFCTCNQLIDKRISYSLCKSTKTNYKDKILSH